MARPNKEFSKKVFEGLCSIMCTEKEICSFFETTDKTLNKWCKREYGMGFSDIYKIKSQNGRISIRRLQFKSAEKGNPSMLIWLGKQYLGQSEETESKRKMQDAQTKRINAETNKIESNMASGFDASSINDLNKSVLENVAPTRDLEDFE